MLSGSLLPLPFDGRCDLRSGAIDWSPHGGSPLRNQVIRSGEGQLQAGAVVVGRLRFLGDAVGHVTAQPAETLLARWIDRGDSILEELSGEFLIALWDVSRGRGLLAVDRFSCLPLFWAQQGASLGFSTRPATAAVLGGRPSTINWQAAFDYAYFHMIPAPLSIFEGVRRLDMGEALRIENGRAETFRYWNPVFNEHRRFDFGAEREIFLAALQSGIADCSAGLSGDQLGCFLSGGTDSSTIAGLAVRHFGAPVKTFSIGFDVGGYDESMYSRLAAKYFGTQHTEYHLTADDMSDWLEAIATQYEQPFGNASAVPTFFCAKLAREAGVTRMLGGDGGDELYGGNERYAKQAVFAIYQRVPAVLRESVLEPVLFGRLRSVDATMLAKARSYVEQANEPLPDRLQSRYNLVNRHGARQIFTDAMLDRVELGQPIALEREVWARARADRQPIAQINQLLAWDLKFTLADSDLPKVTRMCHAAGVEVAFPMLTHALVEHSLGLRPLEKLKGRRLRHFFKEALRGFLPDEIIAKKKQGFGVPFGDWLLTHQTLGAKADDALRSLAARGVIRPGFQVQLMTQLHSGHAGYFGTLVWILMIFELWLRGSTLADERL